MLWRAALSQGALQVVEQRDPEPGVERYFWTANWRTAPGITRPGGAGVMSRRR